MPGVRLTQEGLLLAQGKIVPWCIMGEMQDYTYQETPNRIPSFFTYQSTM